MSSNNFAQIGRVVIPSDQKLSHGLRGMVNNGAVIVGVRADIGNVVVQTEGDRADIPTMPPAAAAQLGSMITRAAAVADELHEAFKAYQAALQQAETNLAQAFSREVGA